MKKMMIAAALALLAPAAFAGTATVTWVAPTTRVDGSPLPVEEIKEYKLQRGTCSSPGVFGTITETIVVPTTASSYVFASLVDGTYCFRMRTLDTSGQLSDFSNVGSKTIVTPKPTAPTSVTVQ